MLAKYYDIALDPILASRPVDDEGSIQAIGCMEMQLLVFNVGADVEGDRYPLAKQAMPDLAGAVEGLLAGHEVMLGDALSEANCQAFGQLLWERATESSPTDDRRLYWRSSLRCNT